MADDPYARIARLEAENAALRVRETALVAQLTEEQAQQAATAQVLRSIAAGAPGALSALQEIVEAAAKVCQADNVALWSVDGDEMVAGRESPSRREHGPDRRAPADDA